ncbi:MAG: hypothetical protein JNK11_03040 [Alphaproteobacteria bacterium]|nr:hypothetical protein [Alphaproteobacteria bacterium]
MSQLVGLPRAAVVAVTLLFVGWAAARAVREIVGAAAATAACAIGCARLPEPPQ